MRLIYRMKPSNFAFQNSTPPKFDDSEEKSKNRQRPKGWGFWSRSGGPRLISTLPRCVESSAVVEHPVVPGTAIPVAGAAGQERALLPRLRLFRGRRIWRRNLSVARGRGLEVRRNRCTHIADRPTNSTREQIQVKWILPIFGAVTDGGVEHFTGPVHARPHDRIRRALVR